MRSFHRALATTVASLAFAATGIAGAGSALASPEDGEGCVGTPAVPASYICVISLTPGNALPGTSTSTISVPVPPICYYLACTEATTVDVPVPGVSPSEGVVAVLWYQGQYIPISVGTGQVTTLVDDTVDLAVEVALGAVDTALGVVATVQDVIDGLPSSGEVVQLVMDRLQPTIDRVNDIIAGLPTVEEIEQEVAVLVAQVQQIIDDLPSAKEILAMLQPWVDFVRDAVFGLVGPIDIISCDIDALEPFGIC